MPLTQHRHAPHGRRPLRPTDCSQWASTVCENRGKKANKLGAGERGFLNHPVHKVLGVVRGWREGELTVVLFLYALPLPFFALAFLRMTGAGR
jgi:hypothetical protein